MTSSSPQSDSPTFNGHTLEELSDYLHNGRQPPNPDIDNDPDCRHALDALDRLQQLSLRIIEEDETPTQGWFQSILTTITSQAKAGRSIPIAYPNERFDLSITEGAVRGLIRRAGDAIPGAIVERSELEGDVTIHNEPVVVTVRIAAHAHTSLPQVARQVRKKVSAALFEHTELNVRAINVTVDDLYYSG